MWHGVTTVTQCDSNLKKCLLDFKFKGGQFFFDVKYFQLVAFQILFQKLKLKISVVFWNKSNELDNFNDVWIIGVRNKKKVTRTG